MSSGDAAASRPEAADPPELAASDGHLEGKFDGE
jgi:hypothetical protein